MGMKPILTNPAFLFLGQMVSVQTYLQDTSQVVEDGEEVTTSQFLSFQGIMIDTDSLYVTLGYYSKDDVVPLMSIQHRDIRTINAMENRTVDADEIMDEKDLN